MVVYSATKHIDGQGRVCWAASCWGRGSSSGKRWSHTPSIPAGRCRRSPRGCCLKGLETLDLRVRAQADNSAQGGRGAGGRSEAFAGDLSGTRRAIPITQSRLRQLEKGRNRGLARFEGRTGRGVPVPERAWRSSSSRTTWAMRSRSSPIRRPRPISGCPRSQRAALGIGPGLVRLSVGLEDAEDLIADLKAGAGGGLMEVRSYRDGGCGGAGRGVSPRSARRGVQGAL